MDETVNSALDFWGGSLADVKEVRNLIPPSKNVKLGIESVEVYDTKEGIERDWKFLLVKFNIEEGIEVGEETKYKNMGLTEMIAYFANPEQYDYNKDFFAKGQFLVSLQQLVKATGVEVPSLVKGGLPTEVAESVAENLKGKVLLGNIVQSKVTEKNIATGKYEPTGEFKNEVRNFKAIPEDDLV